MILNYIDPGYGNRMYSNSGAALADGTLTVVENDTYNPFSGVSFTRDGAGISIYFPSSLVPPKPVVTGSGPQSGTRCIKYSIYCDFDSDSAPKLMSAGFNGNGGQSSGQTGYNLGLAQIRLSPEGWYPIFRGIRPNTNPFANVNVRGFHNITIFLSTGIYSSGNATYYTLRASIILDNINYSDSWTTTTSSRITSTGLSVGIFPGCYISNVLGAGTTIPNQMQVVRLPIKSTDTNMAAGENGEYIATGIDQTLLQTIDTAQLTETYGKNTAISHIVVGSFPCYTSSAGVNLVSISKKDDEITTHGRCIASNDSLGAVSDFWEVDGQTLADLANIQVGWKAGA